MKIRFENRLRRNTYREWWDAYFTGDDPMMIRARIVYEIKREEDLP